MLTLNNTSSIVRAITGSAANVKSYHAYIDHASGVFTPGPSTQVAAITTATTTTIVAAPAASTQRSVGALHFVNDHASQSTSFQVEMFDGSIAVPLWGGTLLAKESITLDEMGVWTYKGADGVIKAASLLTFQQLAAFTGSSMSAAETDTLKIFARKVAGRMTPKYIGPSGVDQVFQDKISENGQVFYLPNNGSTVGLNLGIGWTTGGTVSHPTPSATSPAIYSQQKRTRWANVVTTTNQVLGLRTATAEKRFWRGNAAGLGGWNFHARFAIGLWPAATVRLFVGLNDSNAGWVTSDTLTGNGCGLWHDTTEAANVLNFVTRDGTTATKAAIALAAALAAGQCFDFWMWSAPNGGAIGYRLFEHNTGTLLADTTTSTTLPLTTAFMGPELAMSNGTANVTVTTTAFELAALSCQSDN